MVEAQEKKRSEEWAAREAKISNAMSRMADTVLRKNNEAEKEMEKLDYDLKYFAKNHDKQLDDMKDRPKVVAMGNELLKGEKKKVDAELDEERKKYIVFKQPLITKLK